MVVSRWPEAAPGNLGVHWTTQPENRQWRSRFNVAVNRIRLNPSAVARALGAVAFLLVLASTAGQLSKYLLGYSHVYALVPLSYVDTERNIPTLFSTLLLFCVAILLAVITVLKKKHRDPAVSKWAILAFGFLLMTVDEACSIHEKLSGPVRALLGNGNLGIFHFAWVIPGLGLVFMLALFFLRFVLRLPAQTRLTFVLAASLFIGGSLGLELVAGRYAEMHGPSLTYSMIATLEESLEMAGVIVFIYALLKYIADNYEEVRFTLGTLK
jgi:hypothetical protein